MWTVAALYQFASLPDVEAFAARLREVCAAQGICGTLIVAQEGINGTIAAESTAQMDAILDVIRERFDDLELKMSSGSEKPFQRMKVKVKPEIVTMRQPGVDPTTIVGQYVNAKDWNTLIADPEVLVIDARNNFEFEKGTFEGAIDPGTVMFNEFPAFVEKNFDPAIHKKVAMFCTGGIRCEKASSYMVTKGFEQVYHLKGGILKYLEDIPPEESKWRGRCFVFDERETLGHGLSEDQ